MDHLRRRLVVGRPAVAAARLPDQHAKRDEGSGEVEVEIHDPAVSLGASPKLAVAVHPRMRALDGPAPAGPDRRGHTLAGDLGGGPQRGYQLTGLDAVVVP